MILLPETDTKAVEPGFVVGELGQDVKVNRVEVSQMPMDDPPPAYGTPPPAAPPPPPKAPSPPSDIKAANYVTISRRDGAIRGAFVVDPRLKIPAQLLAPLLKDETEETRRNINLSTKDGRIDADVWVVSDEEADCKCRRKVRVGVHTGDGNVGFRLHTTATNPYTPRTPLSLKLHTGDGHVNLELPRAFRGPLTVHLHDGRLRLSPALTAVTTIFSESNGISRCFIGDYAESGWADAPGEWTGDEAEVTSRDGNLNLWFDDEKAIREEAAAASVAMGKGKGREKGFFGRLFGGASQM
ncbi:hypothetical protein MKEN_00466400 [Mycena kentingensis (nom. inval.)]|nr:hypothetical protein MKEN_00466400 [Mycena kentingensis (nom. inval.)]